MDEGMAVAGRYRLTKLLGAGGMGQVWQSFDELLGRTVAVKVVLPDLNTDPDFVRRFLAEARAMASVHHPGVVAIHDFGEAAGGVAYIVMEYVAGETLSQVLGRSGRISPASTMDLISRTAQALQAVHNRGIIHRDIKPSNLMVRAGGAIALADFGIAVTHDRPGLTQSGAILGTPSYLAPEQVMGHGASALSDIYALGLVAYECLSGQRPFNAAEPIAAAFQRVHHTPPALPPDVPPQVAGVVMRALATDPGQRWQTAAELALAAERAVKDGASTGVAAGFVPSSAPGYAASPGAGFASGQGAGFAPSPGAGFASGQGAGFAPSPGAGFASGPDVAAPATGSSGRAARRRSRLRLAIGAAAVAVTVGAATILWATGAFEPSSPGQTPTVHGASAVTGFETCGALLCPAAPMCWRGLIQQGDRALPPGVQECTAPHYWETFAAIRVPADVKTDRQLSSLMDRPDVKAACSAEAMAEHSRDAAHTKQWRREAWPIQADAYTLLVHCLAGSSDGETVGAAFG